MRFEDMNWMDIEGYLKNDDRVMLVLGACEQHAYLSVMTDVKVPMALADAASKATGVLVAPPINFGISPYFLRYPGTISFRVETLTSIVEDIIRSLYQSGFRKMLLLNGHGGNQPASQKAMELLNEFPDLKIAWYAWWQSHSVESVARKHQLKPYHASWSENFNFVRVADVPQIEKTPPSYQGLLNADQSKEVFGDGVFGGKYQAEEEVMQEVFEESLKDILHLLNFN